MNIIYVDDKIDAKMSDMLEKISQNLNLNYNELEFDNKENDYHITGLKNLNADIIFLDIKLFENMNKGEVRISGFDLVNLYKYVLPLSEIILISSTPEQFEEEVEGLELVSIPKNIEEDELSQKIEKKLNVVGNKKKSLNKLGYEIKSDILKTSLDKIENNSFSNLTDDKISELINIFEGIKDEL